VQVPERTFNFVCVDEAERDEWVAAICRLL
jgi:hypothetical protein